MTITVLKIMYFFLCAVIGSVITGSFSKLPMHGHSVTGVNMNKINYSLQVLFTDKLLMSAKEFVKCHTSDLAFDECVRSGLQSAIPQLAMGIPSLGLLKMDPLRILKLGIDQGTPSIKLKLNFKDLDIINMRSLIIKKAIYDPVNSSMSIESEAQQPIILQGLYAINGQILVLPIIGNGQCKISLENFKLTGILQMTQVLKNGSIFLEVQDLSWKFTTSKIHIKFDNLFNGNKALGNHMNIFLNENWRELFDEMQSSFEQALSSAFLGIIQKFFNQVPLKQIFSD